MNRKSIKGFTLVELLAVLIILAALMAIGIPIVERVINKSKDEINLNSAESYLSALKVAINVSELDNQTIPNGTYEIMKDGNVCIGNLINQNCSGYNLKVNIKGNFPEKGKVTITDGKITYLRFIYNDKIVGEGSNGELAFVEDYYQIGDEVKFNPGDGIVRTWNVIGVDKDTVTLLLSENLGETVAWYAAAEDNGYGPKDALEYLNSLTSNWIKVDPIASYSYVNNQDGTEKPNGYQKIEIINGVTKITHKDGRTTTTLNAANKARAILLTKEEVFEIATKGPNGNKNLIEENLKAYILKNLEEINTTFELSATTVDEVISGIMAQDLLGVMQNESKYVQLYFTAISIVNKNIDPTYNILLPSYLYQNLTKEMPVGYWTLSAAGNFPDAAWNVFMGGLLWQIPYQIDTDSYYGIRPVITIPKTKLN